MLKIFLTIMLFNFISCGTFPKMERKIQIWNGSSEYVGIVRLSSDKAAVKAGATKYKAMAKMIIQDAPAGADFVSAYDHKFDGYAALTWEDINVLYKYIETLKNSCQQWKK